MSTLLNLRKISLAFRRISSNLLNCDRDDADVCLIRFINYIEETPELHKILHDSIDGIMFDYKECFVVDDYNHLSIRIPVNEKHHLKAQYDYAKAIIGEENNSVYQQVFKACRGIGNDKHQQFMHDAFKPMIDYINDEISAEIMMLEDDVSRSPMIYQHIENNHGTANVQGTGVINSTTTNHSVSEDIIDLINRIIPSLDDLIEISPENIEDIKDDLESITEQVKSSAPKKSRLQKALNGVKKFTGDVINKVTVTLAAGAITNADWNSLIEQIEQFIQTL